MIALCMVQVAEGSRPLTALLLRLLGFGGQFVPGGGATSISTQAASRATG